MRKKKLFEYAVLHHITDDDNNVTDTKIIVEPDLMLEKDSKTVGAKVYRMLPDEVIDDLENVEIIIRPF